MNQANLPLSGSLASVVFRLEQEGYLWLMVIFLVFLASVLVANALSFILTSWLRLANKLHK